MQAGMPNIGKTVVFGFGAQGKAHALNLRDSGVDVSVFVRAESKKVPELERLGLHHVTSAKEAASAAQVASIMLPDMEQASFYRKYLKDGLPTGSLLVFAHGFSLHYNLIEPRKDLDVALVAPLSHGDAVRSEFASGGGVPCIVAVSKDATGRARERAMDYARTISLCGPFIDSTVKEEVESDLFIEQALLCGGLPELVRATFDALVSKGCNPDIAYFSCIRELSPIVELMKTDGIAGMRSRISDTARFGSLTRGKRIIGDAVKEELEKVLCDISSGAFADEFMEDRSSGNERSRTLEHADAAHAIEARHKKLCQR
jgi:ketol-acid reductoisomerase